MKCCEYCPWSLEVLKIFLKSHLSDVKQQFSVQVFENSFLNIDAATNKLECFSFLLSQIIVTNGRSPNLDTLQYQSDQKIEH